MLGGDEQPTRFITAADWPGMSAASTTTAWSGRLIAVPVVTGSAGQGRPVRPRASGTPSRRRSGYGTIPLLVHSAARCSAGLSASGTPGHADDVYPVNGHVWRGWRHSVDDAAMDVFARTAANRRLVADFFDELDQEQLETASLCQAWTVREVLGHLVMPMTGGLGGFLLKIVRAGGSVNRASEATARELARRPVSELTALLRDKADDHGKAPGVGPMGQMTDGCVHLRDCARPLGLPDDVSADDWRMVLDWLPTGVPGLVPKRRLEGLSVRATDQDWSWGNGDEIVGPSEALAMAVSGRAVALEDLSGSGVELFRHRLPT